MKTSKEKQKTVIQDFPPIETPQQTTKLKFLSYSLLAIISFIIATSSILIISNQGSRQAQMNRTNNSDAGKNKSGVIDEIVLTPTCQPRPKCLDESPKCLIPEAADMCPPETTIFPTPTSHPNSKDGCIISGCSGEICSDKELFSTCIFNPTNACFKYSSCERQDNGKCGWTQTEELVACLEQ